MQALYAVPGQGASHIGGVFLMLDHMKQSYGPGEAVGAPDHPHRGFETVTYILQGSLQHKDSQGNTGNLGPGWVQWMTAGSGVVHSEMPSEEIMRAGGTVEGFQLWVNLPAREKMVPPRYQDTPAERIPVVPVPGATHEGSTVKVIAGTYGGVPAVISTRTPITYLDVRLGAGDAMEQHIPEGQEGFVYVYRGTALVGSKQSAVQEGSWVSFADDETSTLSIRCPPTATAPCAALLIYGTPINEPIARQGPFVMNTREELLQAFQDYREGKLGEISGREERYAATEAARKMQQANGRRDL